MAAETELERMVIRLVGESSQYIQELQKAQQESKRFVNRIGGLMQRTALQMRSIGLRLGLAVTAPLTALAYKARSEFSNFQASLSTMEGLVGLSAETVEGFKEEILALAPAVGKAPAELSEAMFFITSAGLRGERALEALEVSAKAAASGMGSTKSVADAATSAMNAYGHENLSATRSVEILTAAVRAGKADAASFAPQFGQLLPLAKSLGISFESVAGSLAFLTKTTGNASLASTGFKGVLRAVNKPAKEVEKLLEEQGVSLAKLQENFSNMSFDQALFQLKDALDEAGIPLKRFFTDSEGLTAALQFTGEASSDLSAVIGDVTDSIDIVDDAFGKTAKTAKHQWNAAMAEMRTLMIELGGMIAPFMGELIDWGEYAMQIWKGLSDGTKEFVVAVGAVVAGVSPALLMVSTLITSIGTTLPIAIMAANAAFTVLSASMTLIAAHPFVATLAVLTTAYVAYRHVVNSANREMEAFSESTKKVTHTGQALIQHNNQIALELQDLAQKNELNTQEMTRAKAIIVELEKSYGDLGISVDQTTGQITGLTSGFKEMEEAQRRQQKVLLEAKIRDLTEEFKAQEKELRKYTEAWSINAYRAYKSYFTDAESDITDSMSSIQLKLMDAQNALKALTKGPEDAVKEVKLDIVQKQYTNTDYPIARFWSKAMKTLSDGAAQGKAALEEVQDGIREASEEMEQWNEYVRRGNQITKQYMTPQEKYAASMKELDTLLETGAIGQDTYKRAVKGAKEELQSLSRTVRGEVLDALGAGTMETAVALEKYRAGLKQEALPELPGLPTAGHEEWTATTTNQTTVSTAPNTAEERIAAGVEALVEMSQDAGNSWIIKPLGLKGL